MPQSEESIRLSKAHHRQQMVVLLLCESEVEHTTRMKLQKTTQWPLTVKCLWVPELAITLTAIQNSQGQKNILTTEIYTHVSNIAIQKIVNPIDEIISKT